MNFTVIKLAAVQFFVAFADNAIKSAFSFLLTYHGLSVFGLNTEVELTVGALIFVSPFFLFSGIAGSIADQFDRMKVIQITRLAEIPLALITCVAIYYTQMTVLLLCLFCYSMQTTFFATAKLAVLPDIASGKLLVSANGLLQTTTLLGILVGLVFGGITIGNGYTGIFYIAILLSCIIGAFAASSLLGASQSLRVKTAKVIVNPILANYEAVKLLFSSRLSALSALCISWFWAVGLILTSILPEFAKTNLNVSANATSLLIACFVFGIGAGAYAINQVYQERVNAKQISLAALGMAIFFADLAYTTFNFPTGKLIGLSDFLANANCIRIAIDLIGISFFGAVFVVPLYALLQSIPENRNRAKTMSGSIALDAVSGVFLAALVTLAFQTGMSLVSIFITFAVCNSLLAIYLFKFWAKFAASTG